MPKRLDPTDYIGKESNRLKVIDVIMKETGSKKLMRSYLICECNCASGKIVHALPHAFDTGKTKSCGCYNDEQIKIRRFKHGGSYSRLFFVWWNMKRRCDDPTDKNYHHYGGRGIRCADEWKEFEPFQKWALSTGFDEDIAESGRNKITLDRIDTNGNYEPDNCRWTGMTTQARNKRLRKSNKSGAANVYFVKEKQKWLARISYDGKEICLGHYDTKDEAIAVRKQAEADYWQGGKKHIEKKRLLSNNSSGFCGVSKNKGRGKAWAAYITVDKKQIHIGYYDTLDEAAAARKSAEAKYWNKVAE